MSFEAMTELIKPVVGSDGDFETMVEQLMNQGRTSIRPKDRPDREIIILMVQSS